MRRKKASMSGPFDWLKKLIPPMPGAKSQSQLPILRESMLPAAPRPQEKRMTPFSIFAPKKEEPRALIRPPEFFGILTPPPAPPKAPEPAQPALWETIFTPEPETPEEPVGEMFQFLKPSTIREARTHQYPPQDQWPYGEPPLWSHTRWQMPTTYELSELIHQKWDLPGMYEAVLSQAESAWWKREVENSAHVGEPAVMDVDQVVRANPPYSDMGNFLNIPDFVIEQYGLHGEPGLERFTVEVLQPLLERVGKALDTFRPSRELRGWFELEPDQDMNFWIRYKEAKYRPQLGR